MARILRVLSRQELAIVADEIKRDLREAKYYSDDATYLDRLEGRMEEVFGHIGATEKERAK